MTLRPILCTFMYSFMFGVFEEGMKERKKGDGAATLQSSDMLSSVFTIHEHNIFIATIDASASATAVVVVPC